MSRLIRTRTGLLILLIALAPAALPWLAPDLEVRWLALVYSVSLLAIGLIVALGVSRLHAALLHSLGAAATASRDGEALRSGLAEYGRELEAHDAKLDTVAEGLSHVWQTLTGEQRNLGDLANGMVDVREELGGQIDRLRDTIAREQENLGQVADSQSELRTQLNELRARAGEFAADDLRRTIAGEQENLGAVAGGVSELRGLIAQLQEQVAVQQTNLGMVAAGVDDIRRSRAGVELTGERYAALSEALIDIAEQVDALGSPPPAAAAARSALPELMA